MTSGFSFGRVWRTARHLSPDQWLWRAICRGKRATMQAWPAAAEARTRRAAEKLPRADPRRPALGAIATHVLQLQNTVYGGQLDGIAQGRFEILNQRFDFGAPGRIDWRGEFHEGNNPLRRMTLAHMGYAVPLLARGQAADLAVVDTILASLQAQNSFRAPGVFRDVWNAYAASHRLINLLAGLALYRAQGGPPAPAIEARLLDHARFCVALVCATLERDLQFNHLMKNLVALAVYAAGLDRMPREFDFLCDSVPRALRQNVLADGGHAERSPMYHALALLDVRCLAATGLFPETWAGPLADVQLRMTEALAAMSHPDGDIALFNDSWLGEAPSTVSLIGAEASTPLIRLSQTGYVRLNGSGDAVILDCGPCGPDQNPGHAHADFLAIEASVGGRRFIVDPGVATYTAGALRDESRSAARHNGPHVAGAEPIEFWRSFRVGRRGYGFEIADTALAGVAPLWCAGRQTGYAPLGIATRRFIGLWPGAGLLIADLWCGARVAAEGANFLIPTEWRWTGSGFQRDATIVAPRALAGTIGPIAPSRWWPRFGVEAPAHLLPLRASGEGAERRAALWLAWSPAAVPPPTAALERLFAALAAAGR